MPGTHVSPPVATIAPPAARTESLTKVYGTGDTAVVAVDAVTLSIESGRFTALMGPSGSGKSTFLHCLAGLDRATSGRIFVGDSDLTGMNDRALTLLRRRRIGFVFQAYNLIPTLTAAQNIRLPLTLAGKRPDRDWWVRVVDVLRLGDRLDHRPGELSGGQQQRVAMARALVSRPDLVVADEPTGALDSRTSTEMLSFLRISARELGQSVVMVTHAPTAASYADRVVLLSDGSVAGDLRDPDQDRVMAAIRRIGG